MPSFTMVAGDTLNISTTPGGQWSITAVDAGPPSKTYTWTGTAKDFPIHAKDEAKDLDKTGHTVIVHFDNDDEKTITKIESLYRKA